MNRILLSVLVLCVLIFVSACPKPAPEDTGGTTATTKPGVTTTPLAADFRASKLARFDTVSLGMKSDEVSALYPAEGEYKIENPFPTEGAPLMLAATPKEGATGLAKTFGFLEGELVYCMAGGKMTEDEFNAKVEEYKKIYGEPAKDAPQFLKDTEFWSGTKKETTEGTAPEGTETKVPEGSEPTEAGDSGMGADLPENAVFWVDELNKLVLLGGIEDGDAGFFLMRADKIDEQFKAYEKAIDDMMNKAMSDASAGGTTTPPAEGGK